MKQQCSSLGGETVVVGAFANRIAFSVQLRRLICGFNLYLSVDDEKVPVAPSAIYFPVTTTGQRAGPRMRWDGMKSAAGMETRNE